MAQAVRYIDATDGALGRIGSVAAKSLLNGQTVVIVNAQNAVITGNKKNILAKYQHLRTVGSVRKGPQYPRQPHRLLKRVVRGMLPFRQARGRTAYARLTVHIGIPDELSEVTFENVPVYRSRGKFILLGDLSRELGANFVLPKRSK